MAVESIVPVHNLEAFAADLAGGAFILRAPDRLFHDRNGTRC
jgi:hypothetical protein